jgi:hypothetical protein
MKNWRYAFNIYLLVLVAAGITGCKTPEERKQAKEASTLRLFLEVAQHSLDQGMGVPVYRASPVHIQIEREPFLTEAELDAAEVIDMPGGFAIRTQFTGHGAMVLEGITVAHKGQRIVVQSSFGETRWLAAPLIRRGIPNGQFTFTPDATREEAERIVRGLTNVVRKIKQDQF